MVQGGWRLSHRARAHCTVCRPLQYGDAQAAGAPAPALGGREGVQEGGREGVPAEPKVASNAGMQLRGRRGYRECGRVQGETGEYMRNM